MQVTAKNTVLTLVVTLNRPSLLAHKAVGIFHDRFLSQLMQAAGVHVDSLHHQAFDDVGDDLRIVAQDLDHIVNPTEQFEVRFCTGAQWHPEYLPWQRTQRQLFQSLVKVARA